MSALTVEQCFAAPQPIGTRSERFRINVKGEGLTVKELKAAIVRKGYQGLSDIKRIVLIIAEGPGTVLMDHWPVCQVPNNSVVLAICVPLDAPIPSPRLSALSLPNLLYSYHHSSCWIHVRLPRILPLINHAGTWKAHRFDHAWHTAELGSMFCHLGFERGLVARELEAAKVAWAACLMTAEGKSELEARKEAQRRGRGHLAPQLMAKLWQEARLDKVTEAEKREAEGGGLQGAFSVASLSSDTASTLFAVAGPTPSARRRLLRQGTSVYADSHFSAASTMRHVPPLRLAEGVSRVLANERYKIIRTLSLAMTSSGRSAVPSGALAPSVSSCASFSDCASADGTQAWAGDEESVTSSMSWTPEASVATLERCAALTAKLAALTGERDALAVALQAHQADALQREGYAEELRLRGQHDHQEMGKVLCCLQEENQRLKVETERSQVAAQELIVELLESQKEVEGPGASPPVAGVTPAAGVDFNDQQTNRAAEAIEVIMSARENLEDLVTCQVCFERFTAGNVDPDRRPYVLSCGHIFCVSCLRADWTARWRAGEQRPERCFNRCSNFEPGRFSELWILHRLAEVLGQLSENEVEVVAE